MLRPFAPFKTGSATTILNTTKWVAMNKPGQIVQASGIYETVGGRQATLSKGDRFPPTTAGAGWKAVYLTKTSAAARPRAASSTSGRKGRPGKRR